jgi:hypothetical protein
VVITLAAGALVVAGVLATGARAERIGQSVSGGLDRVTTGMGLTLKRVHITGASPEAEPAIQQALGLHADQPIVSLDLDALRDRVQSVGWVKEARVVRLLPDTLIVEVVEHDRLAVWQSAGRAQVIDVSKLSGDQVKFGATVTVVDEDTEEEACYQIVGEHEADVKKGKISIASPIARAMISKEVGDVVEVNTPGGVKAYEILKVEWK